MKEATSIRLEKDLIDRIKNDAIRDKRSITAQIEYMLDQYYEIVDKLTPPKDKIDQSAG